MQIEIIAIGKLKEAYWRDACAEYIKRMRPFYRIEISELKEERINDKPQTADKQKAISGEGERILAKIAADDWVVVLDVGGQTFSSQQMADTLADCALQGNSRLKFIIGGAYGVDERLRQRAQLKLSLGRLTYTHQLARVILLEQLYRWAKINNGEPYHN